MRVAQQRFEFAQSREISYFGPCLSNLFRKRPLPYTMPTTSPSDCTENSPFCLPPESPLSVTLAFLFTADTLLQIVLAGCKFPSRLGLNQETQILIWSQYLHSQSPSAMAQFGHCQYSCTQRSVSWGGLHPSWLMVHPGSWTTLLCLSLENQDGNIFLMELVLTAFPHLLTSVLLTFVETSLHSTESFNCVIYFIPDLPQIQRRGSKLIVWKTISLHHKYLCY